MPLEKELETYKRELPNLLSEDGKFVLIHEDEVVGTFTSYQDAINEGYGKFGLKPFLVKQIAAVEKVQYITRMIEMPCHI